MTGPESAAAVPAATTVPRPRRWPRLAIGVLLLVGLAFVAVPQVDEVPRMVDAVRSGDPRWALVALLCAATGFPAAALALRACSPVPLPFGPCVRMQLASAFTGTATPASVGSLALAARFVQKQGASIATATGTVALQSVVQVLTHVGLLAALVLLGLPRLDLAQEPSWTGPVLIAVLAVVGCGGAAVLLVPRLRATVRRLLREEVRPALVQLAALARSPRRLLLAVLGACGTTLSNAAAMWAALLAFGEPSMPVAAAATTMVAGTLASAAPTPGGVGAVEAALAAGLVGFGVSTSAAVPVVLLYRVMVTWLPVAVGATQLRVLTRADLV